MLLIVLSPSSLSCLVAPKASVARHKADNHPVNHIFPASMNPRKTGKKGQSRGERREESRDEFPSKKKKGRRVAAGET